MVRHYLIGYNLLLALGWLLFLVLQISNNFHLTVTALWVLNIAQGVAVMEIVHALLKWVKTPVGSVFPQVFSRILVLVFINLIPAGGHMEIVGIDGVEMVTVAWSITEVIRYSFYFFGLLNKDVPVLTYLRYTLFLALYPLGVLGEWLVLLSYLKMHGWALTPVNCLLYVLMASYLYFFPKLYLYMLGQRRRKLS